MNTSATGGYALPTFTEQPPKRLNLTQFIQTIFVGITGLDGTNVRPKWQVAPPKDPDIAVNWMAFGIGMTTPDANGYLAVNPDGSTQYQRQETLEINCSIYGPMSFEIAGLIRDGFQIPQNLDQLRAAGMGFKEVTRAIHMPELVGERWFDRYELAAILPHQVQRLYPVLTFLTASGTIHTQLGGSDYSLNWQVEEI